MALAASKAGKQTTGYFAGYTAKKQPVGRYELEQSTRSLTLLRDNMSEDSSYKQL